MHAIHDPTASIDIKKLGRKYGNLKVDTNSKGLSCAQEEDAEINVMKIV
jgi:hypothetical protein